MFFAHGTSNSRGTLIAFREGLNYKVLSSHLNDNGRYVILKVEIQSSPFILINYYAPNEEGQQVLILTEIRDILQKIELEKDTQLIWGGDFNCFFDCKLDANGGNPKLKVQSIAKLVSMMSENDLCDIFRVRNPDMKRYTWRRKTPFKQRRLDYFLISDQLQDQIDQVDIIPSIQSDHSTLKLKICGAKCSSKGPSYWKLNNSFLQDKVFIELIKSEIPKFYQESEELRNPMMRWEYLKYKVRDFSKQYSVDKARERRAKRNKLELRVKEVDALISSNAEETLIQEYQKCKHQLSEEIYNYVTQGIIIRSKVDWYEQGEKSSKYFYNLEKRNKAKSHIRKILNSNLVELSEPETVFSSIKSFYSTLYKKRNDKTETDCYNYLKTRNLPKLTDNESRLVRENSPRGNVGKLYRQWKIIKALEMMVSPKNFMFVSSTKSTHIYCNL